MENKQDKGFTLVELLIVIVILGILATVTVFAVRGITDRGQTNACSVDQRTLDTSIEAFYAQYQRDPANLDELTVGIAPDGPVLKEAPTNFGFVAPTATTGAAFVAPSSSPCYVAPATP
jgi:prepilin-type N-terminal cleavage/methylation domain-containing protein